MIKKMTLAVLLLLASLGLNAQVVSTLAIETRVDEQGEFLDGEYLDSASGFVGKFFNFRMAGNLTDELSYSIRHRINRPQTDGTLFQATDWAYLTYSKENWNISAGKQVVAIGGYEYDRAPINIYFGSEYWNNIACYQFGASLTYATKSGNDKLMFQACESPFRANAHGLYAYNLMWTGSHEWFKTTYSINVMEYAPGKYINYLALGNRFEFGDLALELDFINKGTNAQNFLLEDYCLIGDLCWKASDALNVFVKVSYDRNKSVTEDLCVAAGTDVFRAGGGIEYFPLKNNRNVRLHLNCCYTDGKSPAANSLRPEQTILDAGLTWKLDFLSVTRK
jgi:hypothetical protein